MNADGTFPTVPDNYAGILGVSAISDLKFDPITSTWKLWAQETFQTNASTPGSEDDPDDPSIGSRLAFVNLTTLAKTAFWPSRNVFGRNNPLAHSVFAPACNCLREFVFYTSTDNVCYNDGLWDGGLRGWEVVVRRWLDGPPNQ